MSYIWFWDREPSTLDDKWFKQWWREEMEPILEELERKFNK